MPSILCQSRIRAASDRHSLSLDVRHHLMAGKPSIATYDSNKQGFPQDVDVLLMSNLLITLSGVLDGVDVPTKDIYASAIAQHLVDYLHVNRANIGINTVSKLCNDRDGQIKLVLTSSRQAPVNPDLLPSHVLLVAIDLRYSWKTPDSIQVKLDDYPFGLKLSHSYRILLDNVIGRFVNWQLVKRYPLIFGPWCQQLDKESSYFSAIACSILRIVKRSANTKFRTRCQSLIKISHRRRLAVLSGSSMSLSTYLALNDETPPPHSQDITDEDVLRFALERVYRNGMSRPRYKGIADAFNDSCMDDKRPYDEQDIMLPDEHTDRFCWDDAFLEVPISTHSSNSSVSSSFQDIQSDSDNAFFSDIDDIDNDDAEYYNDELLDLEHHDPEEHPVERRHRINDMSDSIKMPFDVDDNSMLFMQSRDDGEEGLSIESEELDCEMGSFRYLLHDSHLVSQYGFTAKSSQDADRERLDTGRISQVPETSTSLPRQLPLISGLPPNRGTVSMGMHGGYGGYKLPSALSTQDEEHLLPDDPVYGLGFSTNLDTDVGLDLTYMETNFKDCRSLVGVGGASVAMFTRPTFPETSYSHHSPTLGVTCPSQTNYNRQLSISQEELEDSDEQLNVDGSSAPFVNFWEEPEELLVLDF